MDPEERAKQVVQQIKFYSRPPSEIITSQEEKGEFGTFADLLSFVYADRIVQNYDRMFSNKKPAEFKVLETGVGRAAMGKLILSIIRDARPDIYKRMTYMAYDFSQPILENFREQLEQEGHVTEYN